MVFQWQWHKYYRRAWLKTLESNGNLLAESQVCTLTYLLAFMYHSVCIMHVQSINTYLLFLSHYVLIAVCLLPLKNNKMNNLR